MTRLKIRSAILGLAAMAVLAAPAAALAGDEAEPSSWTYNQGSGWTYSPGTVLTPTRDNTAQTPTYTGGWQYSKPKISTGNIDPCIVLGTCP